LSAHPPFIRLARLVGQVLPVCFGAAQVRLVLVKHLVECLENQSQDVLNRVVGGNAVKGVSFKVTPPQVDVVVGDCLRPFLNGLTIAIVGYFLNDIPKDILECLRYARL